VNSAMNALIYALSSLHHIHMYIKNLKHHKKDEDTLLAYHPRDPRLHPRDRTRSIGSLPTP
jgi:hypothetical protein